MRVCVYVYAHMFARMYVVCMRICMYTFRPCTLVYLYVAVIGSNTITVTRQYLINSYIVIVLLGNKHTHNTQVIHHRDAMLSTQYSCSYPGNQVTIITPKQQKHKSEINKTKVPNLRRGYPQPQCLETSQSGNSLKVMPVVWSG